MQKWLRITGVTTLSVGLMLGCSNHDRSDNEDEEITQGGAEQDRDSETETTSEGLPEKEDFSGDASSTSDDDTLEDGLDLGIGESAVIETTIGTAEVTLTGVTIQDTFEDESPELDLFVLANVTVTNLSEHSQPVNDIVNAFEVTPDLEGSGYSEISTHYEVIDTWEGELEPNETAEGQLLYQSVESPQQIIRVNPGLVSAEAVKQDVRWIFTEDDSE
ncbi:hypothetical protein MKY91_03115 [Alkalicoccobacillus gibsonii]|uniref:DUF4352 domain-containing protein n=1 Tax=Alkalicoccobacillus gibsonii TaxID=79881 RepID=A0ABU9VE29_9BACI